ncbi:MAG: ATP:cob(I)alamin adenosyltransferase [Bacteroidetes bacterium 4484_249]|nr:MAG: ATP:cob(I)alamin adenosyltransferase [Bacteroidetes bacterium 4484_249]
MINNLKIYTKQGDKGETSLIGGTRVPKYDERIEAYGTVDELNSFTGLIRDQKIDTHYKEVLHTIQNILFIIESQLAADSPESKSKLPPVAAGDILILENEIDKMNEELPELKSFILPGGHTTVSYCHIARTICRRAERLTIKLTEKYNVDEIVVMYLNRLSDYFFVLARKLAKDLNVGEMLWKPDK